MALRDTGSCEINLPEELFDLDFPGHYFSRIKSVSLSIPYIAEPYTLINATLRLIGSEYRFKVDDSDYKKTGPVDSRFRTVTNSVSAIATSNAQNDSGVFELNSRDERYLPFEGGGAISNWKLELIGEKSLRQFDYNSISDVILHLKYTSREDSTLKDLAIANLNSVLTDVAHGEIFGRLLSLKNDFPDEFYSMKSYSSVSPVIKALKVDKMFFPFFTGNYIITFKGFTFYNKDGSAITFPLSFNNSTGETIDDNWNLSLTYNPADLKSQEDVYLLINYSLR